MIKKSPVIPFKILTKHKRKYPISPTLGNAKNIKTELSKKNEPKKGNTQQLLCTKKPLQQAHLSSDFRVLETAPPQCT